MRRIGLTTALAATLLVGFGSGPSAAATTYEKDIERDCGFLKTAKYEFSMTKYGAESHKWDNAECAGHAWVKVKYKDRVTGNIRYSGWRHSDSTAEWGYQEVNSSPILKSYHKGCADCKEYVLPDDAS
ncbi:hypothetical protein [Streptomyces ureilyticus]|jgi:hypothetical protein|uniref:Uncharacterized protein n=1 Tax=Streptomyces ureilyticus TaxID=1775131 RepID=A0ABX0E700_9ACTN|nr:hypothetical protein [Streptomyces ureilyticus]NGO48443.1 hypothetical protein [Streptomyces ureilyticus]